jgi:hypothetical protein
VPFAPNKERCMKVKIPLGLLILAGVVLYLLGTESGRQQRDRLVRRVRREEAIDDLLETVSTEG